MFKNFKMKTYLLLLLTTALCLGCDEGSFNNNNPYIPSIGFSRSFDLNLPSYSQLQFPGNSIYYGGADAGVLGIIIFNSGSGYRAYDGACPNQELAPCSRLNVSGSAAICPCDNATYNLFTGQAPGLPYPLKPYRITVAGSVITVFN